MCNPFAEVLTKENLSKVNTEQFNTEQFNSDKFNSDQEFVPNDHIQEQLRKIRDLNTQDFGDLSKIDLMPTAPSIGGNGSGGTPTAPATAETPTMPTQGRNIQGGAGRARFSGRKRLTVKGKSGQTNTTSKIRKTRNLE